MALTYHGILDITSIFRLMSNIPIGPTCKYIPLAIPNDRHTLNRQERLGIKIFIFPCQSFGPIENLFKWTKYLHLYVTLYILYVDIILIVVAKQSIVINQAWWITCYSFLIFFVCLSFYLCLGVRRCWMVCWVCSIYSAIAAIFLLYCPIILAVSVIYV